MERAAPPRASPSSLVRITPEVPRRSWNSLALRTASCSIIVRNQQDLAGPQARAKVAHFLHQLFVDVQSSRGIYDQHVVSAVCCVFARSQGKLNRGGNSFPGKAGDANRLCNYGQLLARSRAVDVC